MTSVIILHHMDFVQLVDLLLRLSLWPNLKKQVAKLGVPCHKDEGGFKPTRNKKWEPSVLQLQGTKF